MSNKDQTRRTTSNQTSREQAAIERQPSSYQPSKAELEEQVKIDATPDQVARAIVQGGASRRDNTG